jgi:HEAT repeat protein
MRPHATAAIPALTKNLYYQGPYNVRQAAAEALGEIGAPAKSAVPALAVMLLTDFVHARVAAAEALGRIHDRSAMPALAKALYDQDEEVAQQAAKAIEDLTGQKFPEYQDIVTQTGSNSNITRSYADDNDVQWSVREARNWWQKEGYMQQW